MEHALSKEIQSGLDNARLKALKKSSRLRIEADGCTYKVLRQWKTGFAMDPAEAPDHLRGLVDFYDGAVHLFQCLIIAADEENGEVLFEFKRATPVADRPPLDFEQAEDAPVALIEDYGGLPG